MTDLSSRRALTVAGLLAGSVASLVGGAFLAVPLHGFLRLVVVGAGFVAYVGLFARAMGARGA